jgi:hypothetical protein
MRILSPLQNLGEEVVLDLFVSLPRGLPRGKLVKTEW